MTSSDIVAAAQLPGLQVIIPRRLQDERGFFSEVWREDAMGQAGIRSRFVQENHAFSRMVGTVRGLHFQIGASAQAKLIRCLRGSILDVVVDIRHGSPSFGRYMTIVLSSENWKQLYIPVGFAHGYCTLEPDSEMIYKVSAYYDPASERGLAWDDPEVGIPWPVGHDQAKLLARDRAYPRLGELQEFFPFRLHPN